MIMSQSDGEGMLLSQLLNTVQLCSLLAVPCPAFHHFTIPQGTKVLEQTHNLTIMLAPGKAWEHLSHE